MSQPPAGVIIDLDDTVYPEHDYFLSGLRAVAKFAAAREACAPDDAFTRLEELSRAPEGRNLLFDRWLRDRGTWSADSVATLVHVYRTHSPTLAPFPDVIPALNTLKAAGCKIGLVSDGPSTVQRKKLEALGLEWWLDAIVLTDDLPGRNAKPSSIPFQVAAKWMCLPLPSLAYVADDPSKDFLGPKELGMATICVRRKLLRPLQPRAEFPSSHLADRVVDDLRAAVEILLRERRTVLDGDSHS